MGASGSSPHRGFVCRVHCHRVVLSSLPLFLLVVAACSGRLSPRLGVKVRPSFGFAPWREGAWQRRAQHWRRRRCSFAFRRAPASRPLWLKLEPLFCMPYSVLFRRRAHALGARGVVGVVPTWRDRTRRLGRGPFWGRAIGRTMPERDRAPPRRSNSGMVTRAAASFCCC